jgi:hypothetical protein
MRPLIVITLFTTCLSAIEQGFDTEYKYADSTSKGVIIQNSLPRGGLTYIDPTGKDYAYVIFYTRITNETASPLELTINFPADSIPLPSSTYSYFKLFLPPPDTMTLDKEPLLNYGLDVKSFLDNSLNKLTMLQRTINPIDSCLFYVVAITNYGVDGVVRAGFSLEGQDVFYRIDTIEIKCGQIVFKD